MRFGVFIPQGWRFDLVGIEPDSQWSVMKSLAQQVDAEPGWESVWVYDHFHTTPQPSDQATHEAWTLMAGLGAVTDRVRLGQMCTCMGYRNPAYLAKVAATCDHISGGRIEMGIGGGWYEHEWKAYGYGFPRAGVRLGMLDEGVQIFKQAWETGTATLDGKHYQVDGAIVEPRPVQSPRIPLWIAGGGEKVTLKIAAKYADYTNFAGTPDDFEHKSQVLAEHCREVGTDFDAITRSANYNVFIGRDEDEVAERRAAYIDRVKGYLSEEQLAGQLRAYDGMPGVGTPEQIVENLRGLKARGLGYAITYFPEAAYDTSGMELFAREVIPALQD
ncbi:F420-dependent oxidoreductase-like protein [Propionibacteriaceae bacterium ES.041]|uniref:LLM class F420-dependent oxidoreductase n=1 Tax=Enemella evansiae TaxID=2016499 RepID=UPI000B977EAB|nr:LLM class F420-dependent oxidoreductase [Enemella evansiae]OYN95676.1 LLM class F420-dependent oxidoreductase [Enemella evansiae]PFG68130.1 F420-dependent oxidoreductase-like protein [Propionibacteriaceae bacterium ES.041]